jgi:hypothetical protein
MKLFKLHSLLMVLLLSRSASAYHKVGNGDDGSDLEKLAPLTSGPIVDARQAAVALLEKLGTSGVRSLGLLLPEVKNSELFKVEEQRSAKLENEATAFHADWNGQVYARTIAQPHAPTRFFPVSEKLSRDQLIALHVHEGLHRALPESIREDESKVSEITLAITSPESNQDQVRAVIDKLYPEFNAAARPIDGGSASYQIERHSENFRRVSSLSYTYRQFLRPSAAMNYPIYATHTLQSDLYPFGGPDTPFGMGLEASMLSSNASSFQAGPLGISARLRVWQRNGFDIGLWTIASLNMLSAEELKNSPYGRNVFTGGISIRKRLSYWYFENFLSVTLPGNVEQVIGLVPYRYAYGEVINAKIRTGLSLPFMDLGAYCEAHLASYFRVSGGAFTPFDSGAYRLVSAGPEVSLHFGALTVSGFGRFLIDATKGANFDFLGNVMGAGTAQGSLGSAVTYAF